MTNATTYSNKSNANRAAKARANKAPAGYTYHVKPEGDRFVVVETAPAKKPSKRGGGRKFMTGVQIRRTNYEPETQSDNVFKVCGALAKMMDMPVPYRAHVVELSVSMGVSPATASAAYTHWKQVNKLDVRPGRPDAAADEKFAAVLAKVL